MSFVQKEASYLKYFWNYMRLISEEQYSLKETIFINTIFGELMNWIVCNCQRNRHNFVFFFQFTNHNFSRVFQVLSPAPILNLNNSFIIACKLNWWWLPHQPHQSHIGLATNSYQNRLCFFSKCDLCLNSTFSVRGIINPQTLFWTFCFGYIILEQ